MRVTKPGILITGAILGCVAILLASSGCGFVQRVDKECTVLMNGQTECFCRDRETGRFAKCP